MKTWLSPPRLIRDARTWLVSLPIRVRMLAAFLVTALVPLGLLTVMGATIQGQMTRFDAAEEISKTAQQTARQVDAYLRERRGVLATDAQTPAYIAYLTLSPQERSGSADANDAFDLLRLMARRDPVHTLSFALLDPGGHVVLDTDPLGAGRDEAQTQYVQELIKTGGAVISPVLFGGGAPRLVFCAPVNGANGELIGMLRSTVRAAVLQELLTSTGLVDRPDTYNVLVDAETYLRLAHTSDPKLLYKTYAELSVDEIARLQQVGRLPQRPADELSTHQPEIVAGVQNLVAAPIFTTSAAALGGDPATTTAAYLQEADWLVLTRQSQAAAEAQIGTLRRGSLALAVISALLAAAAAAALSRALTAPLLALTRTAERAAIGDLSARAPVSAQDEIGALASTFNDMADQLQQAMQTLEGRVIERTRALELSAEVSRRLSTILDVRALVAAVVEMLQQTFDYYHVHMYLYDGRRDALVMAGGTGEPGRELLERGHTLQPGLGLVGRAYASGLEVICADTLNEPGWLANSLLPETRSEIAMPIKAGDDVLGVLDVQHRQLSGLGQADVDLLRGIAHQTAIALQNARRFEQAQRRAERERQAAEAIQQIQSTRSVSEALQTAMRELGCALQARRVYVALGTDSAELESNTRRLTRKGWEAFVARQEKQTLQFVYDGEQAPTTPGDAPAQDTFQRPVSFQRPLKVQGEPVGLLTLEMSRALDSDDQALLDAVAARLSEHLERLRLVEQTSLALAETEGLYGLIAQLSAAGDFDDILRALAESGWLRRAQAVLLSLFDHPWNATRAAAERSLLVYPAAHLSDLPLEMVEQAALDGLTADAEALVAIGPQYFAHSQLSGECERILATLCRRSPTTAGILFLPLSTSESCIGFIVSIYDQEQAWSAAEIERLAAIADQVATAVRSQVLLQQARARARQEQRLRAANTQVFAAADINAVMRRAVEQVGQALGAPAYIYLDRAVEGGGSGDGA